MTLTTIDIFNGLLSIAIITTYFVVGLNIAQRYFQYKQKEFLYFGICWSGIICPWFPSSISFLMFISTGITLPLEIYLIIGNTLIPILLHIWIIAVSRLILPNWRLKLIIINIITGILFELVFYILLIYDSTLLGELKTPVDVIYSPILMIYIFYVLILIISTVSLLAHYTMKSNDSELKLKGKLIIIGTFSWICGAIMDSAFPLNFITLPLSRIILIWGAIAFYWGLIMPEWIKSLFQRRDN